MSGRGSGRGSGLTLAGGQANSKSLQRLVAAAAIELPAVEAPSLNGLEVVLTRPPDLPPQDLSDRLALWAHRVGDRRYRKAGEALEMEDDVNLDVLGYAQGKLIPFSVQIGAWLAMVPSEGLPGFFEALVGQKVGSGARLELTLPGDFAIEPLRGLPAVYLADIVAARQVNVPHVEDPAFIRRLGRGSSMEEVMASIADELTTERAQELQLEAVNQVLDILAARVDVEIPEALVDEQIRALWRLNEAPLLLRKEFSPQEQEDALGGWMTDVDTRTDIRRRIAITATVRAIAERDGIRVTREGLQALAKRVGGDFLPEELGPELEGPSLHLMVIEHVMKQADIQFVDGPPDSGHPGGDDAS